MDAWRTVVVFVFSVSVCILSTRGSAGRQRAEDFLQSGGGDSQISDSPQPNEEDRVERLWVNCRTSSPARSKLQKLIAVMAPQTKYTLLDCLNRQSFRATVSGGENGSKICKLNEDSAISPAVEPPNYSPAPSHGQAPKTFEEFKPIGDEGSIGSGSGQSVGQDASTARQLRHTKQSKEDDDTDTDADTDTDTPSNTTIIVSIVRNDILTDNGKKDEMPLLTVSSSSTGSSLESFHPGNSVKKEKFEISSFKTK
ncbi:hypothetical protein MRB53_022326 [Persea americana]|uniref:Uncharacterized protein n=1 Tax=Persea americana TaxID=3435 RepID=A0ACC2L6U8_PERAE|nr:hypothetical protein MRB53_022326 [Persea americana]